MKPEILLATQRAMEEYYSDPQLMNDMTVEQHIADCISGLVEKLSYASPASSGVQNGGQYIPNLKNIWQVRQIKCGNDNITMIVDTTTPNDEIWFVDADGHTQKFKMTQTP